MTRHEELTALAERIDKSEDIAWHYIVAINKRIHKLCAPDDRPWPVEVPDYLRSLDAAMTLLPEGWSLGLGDLRGYNPIIWRAHLRDHNDPNAYSRYWVEGHATDPAAALTAACLRAIAAMESDQ